MIFDTFNVILNKRQIRANYKSSNKLIKIFFQHIKFVYLKYTLQLIKNDKRINK